ncbi:succinylglutamate desuccinylase/aspartoacylase family protein [Planctobacterium marinum]|uniref:succinylglutamate desuccinylase/aspartoacylase family protein n=1 Tax=Planctobacterium marinum TaxID=1631968 RepID=UPI001E45B529|nr:succinylglutamate desuccinylase/aspartoacylase family protein [Planctobacterium marinum]MCC2608116.1 succinylglutamate desuccinylase/aspartoacylase family protein [Planctobacterium marinum]
MERVFAELDSGQPGPLIIVVAALHGNEHVGFRAMDRLAVTLKATDFIGKIVGITGNLIAANRNERFIERDLNRFFVSYYLNAAHSDVPEWHEARHLIDHINGFIDAHPKDQEVYLLDMHSMSGHGTPFTCFPHTQNNEQLAQQLPLPAIADLVEILPGTLTAYYADKVTSTIVVECGQHNAEITQVVGENALACFLRVTGCLINLERYRDADSFLRFHTQGAAQIFTRVKYRYHIAHQGFFEMLPGFENLQMIAQQQLLANDKGDEVRAPFSGRMVLPSYQKQGDDGFFIAVDDV